MSDRLAEAPTKSYKGLEEVERRILWLSSLIVHEANRTNDPAGVKVGGHQASSASCTSILTALYFNHLTGADRIAVKPHASPVLYAAQYLLGRIPRDKLRQLRSFEGLQAYPSQTKNPEIVDYSTGSVGLGAVATNFSALTARYLQSKGALVEGGNFWAVVGDAELDEGNVWEALAEPLLDDIPGIRWVVDLNRQSLDRVIPDLRVHRLERLFEANAWRVIEAKYGRRLVEMFDQKDGDLLKLRIDGMANEEFQSIVSGKSTAIVDRLTAGSRDPKRLAKLLSELSPKEMLEVLTDLGGHDQEVLDESFQAADSDTSPAVVFAYTVKGWGLPFAGDPLNHSALMTKDQVEDLAVTLDIGEDWYELLDPATCGGRVVEEALGKLSRTGTPVDEHVTVPITLDTTNPAKTSSQEAFGRTLTELARSHSAVANRIVTAAPDVSISTNLAGWINKVGSWKVSPRQQYGDSSPLVRWNEAPGGQHFELGISEMNLFGLLAQLGLSAETFGPSLAPIGTVYDTFISRGLDALLYGLYCGSSFVIVGTPSGISLAPEGGAHQSTFTPGLGVSLPNLLSYEPCYAKEVEWTLLEGINRALSHRGSTYLRLSTLPIDQSRFPSGEPSLRDEVLEGAYRLIDRRTESSYAREHAVLVFAAGVAVPGACDASDALLEEGVFASVINVTSADQLFRKWDDAGALTIREASHQPNPFPDLVSREEIGLPALVVADGHPHNMAFLGSALNVKIISIGVSGFGESGTVGDVFRKHQLDPESIVNAAVALVDRPVADGGVLR